MLHTFVSSQAARWGSARLGVASFSVLAHATLVTFAVVESGRATDIGALRGAVAPMEHLRFVSVHDLAGAKALIKKGAFAHAAAKASRLLVPDLTKLRALVDAPLTTVPKVPEIAIDEDYASRVSSPDDFGKADAHDLVNGSSMWAITHPGPNGAYTTEVVEKAAWPREDNPRPRYPDALKRAGIEGSFLVEFVVDSTGRVDPKTLSFPKAAHPAFLQAVKDALLRSRYFPAELAGMRVRQLVSQQFTFVIAR
jgi:TonB family protein